MRVLEIGQASRPISTRQLQTLPSVHLVPINLVVYEGSLEGLATLGTLVLRPASRLDAFSGYPFRT